MIYVVSAKLDSIKERWVERKRRKKQYAFVFNLEWSDSSSSIIWRSYNDFFDLQCGLLDSFPEETGTARGFVRIIPYLPGIFAYLMSIGISVTKTTAWRARISRVSRSFTLTTRATSFPGSSLFHPLVRE